MSLVEAFVLAITLAFQPTNLLIIFIGVLLGMFMGIMPGLGGTVALALLIPITFGMDPLIAFMLMTAAVGGTNFGGSITAILINTPGGGPNTATLIDGYPMARAGRGGEAIGASAMASGLGAFFGIAVFIISIPFLMTILFLFGPPEIFWLGVWGLTIISVIVKGGIIAGLIAAGFGILASMHGIFPITMTVRWDYGLVFMWDGMPLVHAIIGLFAVSEMIKLISEGGTIAKDEGQTIKRGDQWKGARAVFEHKSIFARSATIGAIVGTIPGAGGTIANFLAYFNAVQSVPDPEKFGTGDIRGVIAPEASNDAKDGTMLIPTLGFGVPGSAAMAVLLGAFVLHGIMPGPFLFADELPLVAMIIVALVISNVMTSTIGLIGANHFVKVTRIDVRLVAPIVLLVAFFGSYALNHNIFQISITLFFGILGFFMVKVDMSRIPMALGLVLGPIIEHNFWVTLQISRGEYGFFVESWVSRILILLVIVSILLPYARSFYLNRR